MDESVFSRELFLLWQCGNTMHEMLFLLPSPSVALITHCCGVSAQLLAAKDHLSITVDASFSPSDNLFFLALIADAPRL